MGGGGGGGVKQHLRVLHIMKAVTGGMCQIALSSELFGTGLVY